MSEDVKKPDYTDLDWRPLILDRLQKWDVMLMECKDSGWEIAKIKETQDFTTQLIILPIHKDSKRGMIIVCAGGGFMFKSANEAKPVAEYFHKAGINAAILDYHIEPNKPMDLNSQTRIDAGEDGLLAIRYLRSRADEIGILGDHIAIGGFSAGGMIAAHAATLFDYGVEGAEDPMMRISSRPDAALVLYGAMSGTGIQNGGIFGYSPEVQASLCKYDPLRNIKSDCPPMFVFQTHKDDPRHALLFCMELAGYGVPYEIHTFENGPHGGALYDGSCEDSPKFPHTSRWAMLAAEWLIDRGF